MAYAHENAILCAGSGCFMRALLYAEIRKSWKAKRFLAAVLGFLCFFAVVYAISAQKGKAYEDALIMQLHYENPVADNRCQMLMHILQYTAKKDETPTQKEEAYLWCDIQDATSAWTNMRQSRDYFDWHDTVRYANERALGYQKLQKLGQSMDVVKELGITKDTLRRDHAYYTYFLDHDIQPYTSPYEPTLLNFLFQIFQQDTMLLLLLVVSVLMADQICHDYESGTYKLIYSMPISRSTLMIAKMLTASFVIVLSFTIALLLFSILPLVQHGLGSMQYPYIVREYELASWSSIMSKAVPLSMLVVLCYMCAAAWLASWQKTVANTLLCIDSLLIIIYFIMRMFGNSFFLFSWIPFFYLYPLEIAAQEYAASSTQCLIICALWLPLLFIGSVHRINRFDLEGGIR